MLALKKEKCAREGHAFDGKLHAWDYRYYENQVWQRASKHTHLNRLH